MFTSPNAIAGIFMNSRFRFGFPMVSVPYLSPGYYSFMVHIINKTHYGLVFRCLRCSKIHVEFKNLNFNFSEREYNHFVAYINNLDGCFWEMQNATSVFARKIRIPLSDVNSFCFLLNTEELFQLRELLSVKPVSAVERLLQEIAFPLHLN